MFGGESVLFAGHIFRCAKPQAYGLYIVIDIILTLILNIRNKRQQTKLVNPTPTNKISEPMIIDKKKIRKYTVLRKVGWGGGGTHRNATRVPASSAKIQICSVFSWIMTHVNTTKSLNLSRLGSFEQILT